MNPQVMLALAASMAFIIAFAAVGGRLLRYAGLPESTNTLRIMPIAVALGFSAYSYAGHLLLLLFSPLPPALPVALIVGGILLGSDYLRTVWADANRLIHLPRIRRIPPLGLVFSAITVGMLLLLALNALAPTRNEDALSGYMFTARWIASHGLGYVAHNPRYSLFPLGTEVVFSYSFALGGESIAKFLDWFLGIFLIAGIYEFANRYTGQLYSFMAVLGFVVTEQFYTNIGSGKIDIASTLTMVMGWSLLFLTTNAQNLKAVGIASFLVGTSCNQKYTNWIFALTLPLAVMWLGWSSRRKSIRGAALGSIVVLLCVLPHLVRDTLLTDNPIAPFASKLIPTSNVYFTHGGLPSFGSGSVLTHGKQSRAIEFSSVLRLPERLFFDPDFDRLGPFPWLLILGIPAYAFATGRPRELQIMLLLTAVQLTFWVAALGSQWLQSRYLLPVTALASIIAAFGLQSLCSQRRLVKWAVVSAFTVTFLAQGIWHIRSWGRYWRFAAGLETEAEWQQKYAPARGYPVLHQIAGDLGPNRRLMTLSDLYNLPPERLPFVSTEGEFQRFLNTPDSNKLAFLQRGNFAYYYHRNVLFAGAQQIDSPEWCRNLRVVDSYPGDSGYSLYEIPA